MPVRRTLSPIVEAPLWAAVEHSLDYLLLPIYSHTRTNCVREYMNIAENIVFKSLRVVRTFESAEASLNISFRIPILSFRAYKEV